MTRPTLIIKNARVLTMVPDCPRAEAVAITGNRITGVGARDEIDALAGPATRRFDAQGATVMPGMIEAHLHLFPGAFGMRLLNLEGVSGADALRDAVRSYAAANPNEALLKCIGASYVIFGDDQPITRQLLDDILPDRPFMIMAGDFHTAWANTAAMERAGLMAGRALPRGNEIVMSADGTATGELREPEAYGLVDALRSSGGREGLGMYGLEPDTTLTPSQRREDEAVMLEGLKHCASYGFTSLHNMDGNLYQLELLQALETRGDLLCRTEIPFHLTPSKPVSTLVAARDWQKRFGTDRLRSGRVKMFMDGVIDSGTALLLEDYADTPGWRGEPLHDAARFAEAAVLADGIGLQISVHAVGDGAVRCVLDGYASARAANGPRDSRHRIEHIELLHPDDLPRFAELGVIASMQPPHPPGAMDFPLEPWCSRVGGARWARAFPVQDLRAAGVLIAFASDWPVSDVNPMRGVKAAMLRRPWAEGDPSQATTLHEALHGYTAGGAYAGFDEDRLGRLAPGLLADIVVMDRDLEICPPDELDKARAALTLCGGSVTWEA